VLGPQAHRIARPEAQVVEVDRVGHRELRAHAHPRRAALVDDAQPRDRDAEHHALRERPAERSSATRARTAIRSARHAAASASSQSAAPPCAVTAASVREFSLA